MKIIMDEEEEEGKTFSCIYFSYIATCFVSTPWAAQENANKLQSRTWK